MIDYKELYFSLFNKLTDLIEEMKNVQIEAEERYIQLEDNDSSEQFK